MAILAAVLLRETPRHVARFFEPQHVTLGISLYEGEQPPEVRMQMVTADVLRKQQALFDAHPELGEKPVREVVELYPDVFNFTPTRAATFHLEGIPYFAVEVTAKTPFDIKRDLDRAYDFEKLF